MSDMPAIITTRNITKTYQMGQTEVHALGGVSLDIYRGQMVAIVGPSGSGKSTLMAILGALDQPTSGSYQIGGQEVADLHEDDLADIRNRQIGFVFQKFNLLPRISALANVGLPLVYANLPSRERDERARQVLELVDLGDRVHHTPVEMSGGQQQRVAIARALVNKPSIILADEPTGNLDSRTGDDIMGLFHRLHEEQGITLIVVTHDPKIANQTQRIIRIQDGQIVADEAQEKQRPPMSPMKEAAHA